MAKALSEGVTETAGPTFALHPKVKEAEETLFGIWVAADEAIREIVSILPLARDTKALLSGPPGAGKSVLIEGIGKTYFGGEVIGKVQADPSLTPDDCLYKLDLAKLIRGEDEKVVPRRVVTSRLKWLNEFARANNVLQDAFLGLLSEREVEYRDQKFTSPNFLCLADYNPAELGGEQDLSWPIADRFDALVEIPTLSLLKRVSLTLSKYQGKHLKDLRGSYSNVLTSEEMQSVWDDVEKVTVPQPVSVLTEMLMEAITGCVYDRSRVSTLYKEKCSVGRCSFWNEVCSKIERPASFRATDALVSLGKARAWREKRTEISVDDILFLFPYVLAHRAKVKAQFLLPYGGDTLAFYKKEVNDTYEAKAEVWKRAMGYFYEAFRGNKDAISKIRDMADRDLAVKGLFANFEEHIVEILNELASSKGAFTGKELAEAEEYLKLLSAEKQGVYSPKLGELREKLTLTVDRDSYLRLVLPKLAEMEPNAASVVSGEYHGKKFDADISTDDVRLSFTDSETAERVRRIANNKKEVKPES
jgi:MoxR-like ATPase